MNDVVVTYLIKSKEYLKASKVLLEKRLYNASGLASEVSAELALNAILVLLNVDIPRTHRIRKLLSLVYERTHDEKILAFMKEFRQSLKVLEKIRRKSQFEESSVTRDEAEVALLLAEEILIMVESKISSYINSTSIEKSKDLEE